MSNDTTQVAADDIIGCSNTNIVIGTDGAVLLAATLIASLVGYAARRPRRKRGPRIRISTR